MDLLDCALAMDTENTVKTTREIIDSGIQPLTLVSQLAELITDILASGCISAEAQEILQLFGRYDCKYQGILIKLVSYDFDLA